jgi:hypothetical protein
MALSDAVMSDVGCRSTSSMSLKRVKKIQNTQDGAISYRRFGKKRYI